MQSDEEGPSFKSLIPNDSNVTLTSVPLQKRLNTTLDFLLD